MISILTTKTAKLVFLFNFFLLLSIFALSPERASAQCAANEYASCTYGSDSCTCDPPPPNPNTSTKRINTRFGWCYDEIKSWNGVSCNSQIHCYANDGTYSYPTAEICSQHFPSGGWASEPYVCSEGDPAISGQCGSTTNTCNTGNFSDTPDTASENKWDCTGTDGGATASCSTPKATCPITVPGNNKLTGCAFSGVNFDSYVTTAPEGATSGAYADNFTALNQDWGSSGPSGMLDLYSVRWQGTFTFSGGSYSFTAGSDDGSRLYIDNVLQTPDLWSDHGYAVQTYNVNFTANSSHTIKYEYYERGGGAVATLNWALTTPLPKPDLTAGNVNPVAPIAGTPVNFTAMITNGGNASTGSGFSNYFQVATAWNGGGTITDISPTSMPALSAGNSAAATSPNYPFPTAGQYSLRACADKSNSGDAVGSINESNELNNCSLSWTNITVSSAAGVTATLYGTNFASAAATPNTVTTYYGGPTTLTWASSNANSCAISSSPLGNGSWSGLATNNLSPGQGTPGLLTNVTYTLTCTRNSDGATATSQLIVRIPPKPLSQNVSCSADGTVATLNWTLPGIYSEAYVRAHPGTDMQETWPPDFIVQNKTGETQNFNVTPGQPYTWWVHTADNGSGTTNTTAWSDKIWQNFTCTAGAAPVAPACGIPAQAGRTIVNFDSSQPLWNAFWSTSARPVNLLAGNYKVTLHAWDGHIGRDTENPANQTQERMYVRLYNNNVSTAIGDPVVAYSDLTAELADSQLWAQNIKEVDASLYIPSTVSYVEGWWGPTRGKTENAQVDTSTASSFRPICAAFDPIISPYSFTFSADQALIGYGANTTLRWNITNADGCIDNLGTMPTGNWSSALSGNANTGSLNSDTTYSLTCFKAGESNITHNITVQVMANGGCLPSPDSCNTGTYEDVADTSTNYQWICRGIHGGADSPTCTAPINTTLNLTLTKGGYGTVTSNPGGINCGDGCSSQNATFACTGLPITLTAVETNNRKFIGWSGACTGNSPTCTITTCSNASVVAIFTINPVFIEF
jgi:hypothetical protein